MSLRLRLIVSVALVLALGAGVGGMLAGWQIARTVEVEMRAALLVGRQTIEAALRELDASGAADQNLRELVTAFDGNRHVMVSLLDGAGRPIAVSRLADPADRAPGWLPRAEVPAVRLALPGGMPGVVLLRADPANELGEIWGWLRAGLIAAAAFCGLAGALIYWIVGQALRPLAAVSAAFRRIGSGDYDIRVTRRGSPEVAHIADGLNAMTARLAAIHGENRRLQAQLQTLQDEERAGLARDLHDEVGPFLFAAALDAAAIGPLAEQGRMGEVADRAQAVREAIGHVQRHVRAVLRQLRPLPLGAPGTAAAIGTLVAFWQRRRPDIAFEVVLPDGEDDLPELVRAAVCRVVQEGLSNAVRHGRPGWVGIRIGVTVGEVLVQVSDDGAGPGAHIGEGLGLCGMRERVALLGGSLTMGAGPGGRGMAVAARLPLRPAAEMVQ